MNNSRLRLTLLSLQILIGFCAQAEAQGIKSSDGQRCSWGSFFHAEQLQEPSVPVDIESDAFLNSVNDTGFLQTFEVWPNKLTWVSFDDIWFPTGLSPPQIS